MINYTDVFLNVLGAWLFAFQIAKLATIVPDNQPMYPNPNVLHTYCFAIAAIMFLQKEMNVMQKNYFKIVMLTVIILFVVSWCFISCFLLSVNGLTRVDIITAYPWTSANTSCFVISNLLLLSALVNSLKNGSEVFIQKEDAKKIDIDIPPCCNKLSLFVEHSLISFCVIVPVVFDFGLNIATFAVQVPNWQQTDSPHTILFIGLGYIFYDVQQTHPDLFYTYTTYFYLSVGCVISAIYTGYSMILLCHNGFLDTTSGFPNSMFNVGYNDSAQFDGKYYYVSSNGYNNGFIYSFGVLASLRIAWDLVIVFASISVFIWYTFVFIKNHVMDKYPTICKPKQHEKEGKVE